MSATARPTPPASQPAEAPAAADPARALGDPGRLAALRATGLLGAPPLPALERVARLAARALEVPLAQVNLVTFDQTVPVAVCVLPGAGDLDFASPVPREASFCQQVVAHGAPVVVEDARLDPLWRDHPGTTGAGVAAYASMPLRSPQGPAGAGGAAAERYAIGTVCVVDFVPRRWTDEDLQVLADLATTAEAEIARYAGEQRLRAVFDEAPAMLFTVGADGMVLEVNRFGAEALGHTVAELAGRPVAQVFHPDDRAAAAAYLAAVLAAGGEPRTWHGRKLHRDGRLLWVRETGRAVRAADGSPAALVLCEDVTAAKEAAHERACLADEARTARDLLWRVLEQAPVAIAVVRGPQHVYALTNPPYQQLIGHRDVVGRPYAEVFPEVAAAGMLATLDGVYRTGEPYVGRGVPIRYDRHCDGRQETGYFDFSIHPLVEAGGGITGLIAVAAETTDEVRARQEAEAARAEAERQRAEALEANRVKSQFLANMSHELRTPLNAIQGHVQLIELGLYGPVTDEQRRALERVARAQQHLLALINDVLNFAKIEAGRVQYDVRPTLVADVLGDVLPMIEPLADARGHTLVVSMPEDRGDGPIRVLADRDKLGQVLLNLLSNAVKFTPPGGHVEVALRERAGGEREGGTGDPDVAYLTVRDTGIGIRRDRQAAIFDPFVQVQEGLTRPYEGTGLGLAISRDLARGMGGDLRVRSEEGRGATFTVALRRAPA